MPGLDEIKTKLGELQNKTHGLFEKAFGGGVKSHQSLIEILNELKFIQGVNLTKEDEQKAKAIEEKLGDTKQKGADAATKVTTPTPASPLKSYRAIIKELTSIVVSPEVEREYNKILAQTFKDIGDLLVKKGKLLCIYKKDGMANHFKCFTDAAIHYQYTISICTKLLETVNNSALSSSSATTQQTVEELRTSAASQILSINTLIPDMLRQSHSTVAAPSFEAAAVAASQSPDPEYASLENALKVVSKGEMLDALRAESSKRLKDILEGEDRSDPDAPSQLGSRSNDIFEYITSGMKRYFVSTLQNAMDELKSNSDVGGEGVEIPNFSVVGLGSMALGQITPYSDLEFAILTEDDISPTQKSLLRIISHFLHYKVIALGETIIPTSMYDVNLGSYVKRALNFDLGGKTPFGRVDDKFDYDLIATVNQMTRYLTGQYETAKADKTKDPKLPIILQNICPLFKYGDQKLAESYQRQIKTFLESRRQDSAHPFLTMSQNSGIEALMGGTERFKTGNLEEFKFDARDKEGQYFDAKGQIYRIPDRFIYNLGLLFNISDGSISSREILDKLLEKGIITEEVKSHLEYVLAFANLVRLRTYSHYGEQKETMGFMLDAEDAPPILHFRLTNEEVSEDGALFQYYYTAIPLAQKLQEICKELIDIQSEQDTVTMPNVLDYTFYEGNSGNKAQVYMRLAKYNQALEQAIKWIEECSRNIEDTKDIGNQIKLASALSLAGKLHSLLSHHTEAQQCHKESLEIQKQQCVFGDKPHPDIADSLGNLGSTHRSKGEYDDAIKYHTQSLQIKRLIYGSEPHYSIATSLNNLGLAWELKGQHDEAMKCFDQSILILMHIYRNEPHSFVAITIDNLGSIYRSKGEYGDAIKYHTQSLEMKRLIFEDKSHPDIAVSLNNLGVAYRSRGEYDKAIEYYTQSLEAKMRIFKGEPHRDIAISLNNLGVAYRHKGNYEEAVGYLNQSLHMLQRIAKNEPNPDVARCLSNIGKTYKLKEEYEKAIEYLTKSIDTLERTSKNKPGLDMIDPLNEIGDVYVTQGDYQKAAKSFKQALEIKKALGHDTLKLLDKLHKYYMQFDETHKTTTWAKEWGEMLGMDTLARTITHYSDIPGKEVSEALVSAVAPAPTTAAPQAPAIPSATAGAASTSGESTSSTTTSATTLFTTTPTSSSNKIVRAISYNITADFFDASARPTADDHRHDWKTRAPFVKQLLSMTGGDIICLQELSPDQALEMQEALASEYDAFFLSQTPSEILPTGAIAGNMNVVTTSNNETHQEASPLFPSVSTWVGKRAGTPLIGTFIKKAVWHLANEVREPELKEVTEAATQGTAAEVKHEPQPQAPFGRFWLNENPDTVPTNMDKSAADKGFGNMNTYRAVLWIKLQDNADHTLYVFNSHYSLSGDSKTRLQCAKLEMSKIREIAGNNPWISLGDRNLIPDETKEQEAVTGTKVEGIAKPDLGIAPAAAASSSTFTATTTTSHPSSSVSSPSSLEEVYKALTSIGRDVRDHKPGMHYGTSSTWLGFTKDLYKSEVDPKTPKDAKMLDIIVSNMQSLMSFIHPGAFTPSTTPPDPTTTGSSGTGTLIPLSAYSNPGAIETMNQGRHFASDHALLGGDFDLSSAVV